MEHPSPKHYHKVDTVISNIKIGGGFKLKGGMNE